MRSSKTDLDSVIFDMMAKFEDNFVFLGDKASHLYRWSANAVGKLDLEEEYVNDPDMWKKLLMPEDYEAFNRDCMALDSHMLEQFRREYRIRQKDGSYELMYCSGWQVRTDEDGRTLFAGILGKLLPNHTADIVTGLAGNYEFRIALTNIVQNRAPWTVMILGIDEFKGINDLYSYSFGDKVLKRFAEKLNELLPGGAMPYRLDGDGFGILFPGDKKEGAAEFYHLLQRRVQTPELIGSISLSYTISGGICLYPEGGEDSENLYRNARMALRTAKNKGKNQLVIYSDEILEREQFKMRLLERLRQSVIMGFQGFSLCFQPLIQTKDNSLYGCEALLRWEHPDFDGGVSPAEFVPVLEESGLIIEVGEWVFETAVKQCAQWGRRMPELQMNINVASAQFEHPDFKFFVMDTLKEYGVSSSMVTLELTESGKIQDSSEVHNSFDFLRGQGVKIAFDDFGTGYASLGIFRVLSADELKIDRSFIERLTYDVTDQKIISQLVSLCHSMNMSVCVEGIETPEIESVVRQLEPELLQGYFYSRPMTAQEFTSYYFRPEMGAESGHVKMGNDGKPEWSNSMVYSAFQPAQPMTMDDIVDNAHAGIFQVGMDEEFSFLTCNEGYRRMLGYTAREMDEKFKNHALGFVHPDDMEYVNDEIRRQLGIGDTVAIEFRVVRADGTPIWILGTGNVVKSRHGNPSLVVVIINNDIIKQQNLKMEKENSFYKKMMANVPTGIKCVRYDPEFTIDYISPGFLSILGYTRQEIRELYDDKYINLIYEEDRRVVMNDILEQLKESDVVTMHYRTPCKDGHLIWVETISRLCPPDADGIQRAFSGVVNIEDSVAEAAKSNALNIANRYQTAVTQWGDILFEYDLGTNSITFSENFYSNFGRKPFGTLEEEILCVHEEDRELILNSLDTLRKGGECGPIEVRIEVQDSGYLWHSIAFSPPDKFGDVPVAVVGKINNIDEEKRERDDLMLKARQDSMTGLLNKAASEEEIRRLLVQAENGQNYALFMMDIDEFKMINDSMGHMNGDKVLCRVAEHLKVIFGGRGIVGRAGGDEFIAFTPYGGDVEEIIEKAHALLTQAHHGLMINGKHFSIRMSIGISLYPEDGLLFYDLYRRADSALYRAKELGKNGFCLAAR